MTDTPDTQAPPGGAEIETPEAFERRLGRITNGNSVTWTGQLAQMIRDRDAQVRAPSARRMCRDAARTLRERCVAVDQHAASRSPGARQ